MSRRPPRSTRTDSLLPYTTLFRSSKAWLNDRLNVPRETWARLELYVACLLEEMQHQNMIASSPRDHVCARHITDSAQLLLHAPENDGGVWLDLGRSEEHTSELQSLMRNSYAVSYLKNKNTLR